MSTLTINNAIKIDQICQLLSNITSLQSDYIDIGGVPQQPQQYRGSIFIPQSLVGTNIEFVHNVTYRRCDAAFNPENVVRVIGVEGSVLSSIATTNSVSNGSNLSVSNTFSYTPTQSGYIYLEFIKTLQFISLTNSNLDGEYFIHVDSQLIPKNNSGVSCNPSFIDLNFKYSEASIDCYSEPSIVYQEINKQETIDGCLDSNLTFSLTGNGTFPLSMISDIEPGGGYVRLSTTNNIINHNGNMVNNVQFITGWTDPQGGSHSQQDEMVITVNGTENFYLEVRASEVCRDSTTNNMILLSCWNGQSSWSSPSASVSLESNGNLLSSLSNIKKLSPCDSISAE